MSNVCYTKYRVEGPHDEICRLAAKINEDNETGGKYGILRGMLYGHTMQKILPEDIHLMSGGWSVVYFEAPSKWVPYWESWQDYVHEVVPQALLYYYGEEFGCNVCVTNDVWRKYFQFDYVTVLRSGHNTRKDIMKAFADESEFRMREDQWKQHFKYWDTRFLKGTLLHFVPYPRRYASELIEAMDTLMARENWWETTGTSLGIYKVKRLEGNKESPCSHCEECYRLRQENYELLEKLQKLEWQLEEQKLQKPVAAVGD